MEEYPHLPEYADLFIIHLQNKGRKKSTIKRYYYDLLDFFAWLRVIKDDDTLQVIQSTDASLLNDFFLFLSEQREYSAATSKRIFTVIKSLFQFLHFKKIVQNNPFKDLEQKFKENMSFTEEDFLTEEEYERLYNTLSSFTGLTEKQQKYRHLLIKRNQTIVALLYHYGLTLQELSTIEMKHVYFTRNQLEIINDNEVRLIQLDDFTNKLLYDYRDNIPESLRPKAYSSDRFFVAFDYQRGTYRFDYSNYEPKPLTVIAIQKMLRQEIRRSGIRNGVSSQHLRRTAILNFLSKSNRDEEVQKWFGLKSHLTLQRYEDYLNQKVQT
jgi:site-specific recombinase XerD